MRVEGYHRRAQQAANRSDLWLMDTVVPARARSIGRWAHFSFIVYILPSSILQSTVCKPCLGLLYGLVCQALVILLSPLCITHGAVEEMKLTCAQSHKQQQNMSQHNMRACPTPPGVPHSPSCAAHPTEIRHAATRTLGASCGHCSAAGHGAGTVCSHGERLSAFGGGRRHAGPQQWQWNSQRNAIFVVAPCLHH